MADRPSLVTHPNFAEVSMNAQGVLAELASAVVRKSDWRIWRETRGFAGSHGGDG